MPARARYFFQHKYMLCPHVELIRLLGSIITNDTIATFEVVMPYPVHDDL